MDRHPNTAASAFVPPSAFVPASDYKDLQGQLTAVCRALDAERRKLAAAERQASTATKVAIILCAVCLVLLTALETGWL